MKKLFLLFMLSLFTISYAQDTPTNLSVTESETFKYDKKIDGVLAMKTSQAGNTGVVLRHGKRNAFDKPYYFFDIFNTEFKQVFSEKVEIDKDERYVGDIFYDGILKVFTVYKPNRKERTVFLHLLDIDSKTYKRIKLFDAKIQKKQSLFASKRSHSTSFSVSPNRKYFALATDNVSKKMNDYNIRVFDNKTNTLVYNKSYQTDEEKTYEHNELYVDNNAVVYSVGKRYLSKKQRKKLEGDSRYKFVLNKITENSAEAVDITLDDKHIQSLTISVIKDELHLLGFYSEKNENRLKGGCSFIIITENFNVKSKKFQKLPKQVYDDLYNNRASERKNKKDKELNNFYIDHIITDSSNNTFLVAEEFYVTSQYVQNGQFGGYWTYVYHYDDILILKFNSEGNLDWGRSIFKKSTSPSYNAFYKDDKLHVILNSGKNLKEKKDGRIKVSKGLFESTSLYDVEFTVDGKVQYNKIQDNRGNTKYIPYYGTYELDRFIMPNDSGRKKQFIILE